MVHRKNNSLARLSLKGSHAAWAAAVVGCSTLYGCEKPEEPRVIEHSYNPYDHFNCSPDRAETTGEIVALELLREIRDPAQNEEACDKLDEILRQRTRHREFMSRDPQDCDWGEVHPVASFDATLRPMGDELSDLCKWPARQLQARGIEILESLPPEERNQIERNWDKIVGR